VYARKWAFRWVVGGEVFVWRFVLPLGITFYCHYP
jgi:hypothetical protein